MNDSLCSYSLKHHFAGIIVVLRMGLHSLVKTLQGEEIDQSLRDAARVSSVLAATMVEGRPCDGGLQCFLPV